MIEVSCSTIPGFVRKVLDLSTRWFPGDPRPDVWFRGTENRDLALLPGAYWRAKCDEQSLVLTFQNYVPSYLSREPSDEWEWYYLMQHYGLPTRLLDWTENPLTALYFALLKEATGGGPCVWVLDPVAFNAVAQGFDDGTIIAPLSSRPESPSFFWLPRHCRRGATPHTFADGSGWRDNTKPLAVFPKRYNPRIVAQRGVFTIHGTEAVALDALMQSAGSDRIARFCFSPKLRSQLQRDLFILGVNKAALFPEPESVAADLKLAYGLDSGA